MSAASRRNSLVALIATSLLACASNPAPAGWRPKPRDAQRQAWGGWLVVKGKSGETLAAGELIAVDEPRLYVLTAESGLVVVTRDFLAKAILTGYGTKEEALAGWTTAGTLSTLSHGVFLIFTAPTWIIAGAVGTTSESRAGLLRYPQEPLASFRPYARFPQGLPPGFDPKELGHLRVAPGRDEAEGKD